MMNKGEFELDESENRLKSYLENNSNLKDGSKYFLKNKDLL